MVSGLFHLMSLHQPQCDKANNTSLIKRYFPRSDYVAHQENLVQHERDFEVVEIQRVFEACTPAQLAKKGLAVLGLTVAGMKTGAGGKRYFDHHLVKARSLFAHCAWETRAFVNNQQRDALLTHHYFTSLKV